MDLTEFYEPVRLLLGDLDATVRRYPDATLAAGVRTAVQVSLPGRYAISPDRTAITPDPDANGFALINLRTALLFLAAQPEAESLRTRGVTIARRAGTKALTELKAQAWKLENGTCFTTWTDWHSWLLGVTGLPLAAAQSQVRVERPFTTVWVTRSGVTSADGSSGTSLTTTTALLQDAEGNSYRLLANAEGGSAPQFELLPTEGEAGSRLILTDAAGQQFYAQVVNDAGLAQLTLAPV